MLTFAIATFFLALYGEGALLVTVLAEADHLTPRFVRDLLSVAALLLILTAPTGATR